MTLSLGIVGLPNVGKSTLFNAITQAMAEASNYPFCTIEPNIGIVSIPDERLNQIAAISQSEKTLHSTVSFTDIAGLVKGASQGEGLGNKFLSNIRETSAIIHVVRCFDDPNITHVSGKIDPISDIHTIQLELILSDLDLAQKCVETYKKKAKSNDASTKTTLALLQKCLACLEKEEPLRSLSFSDEDHQQLKTFQFLTTKPLIYVMNISEKDVINGCAYSTAIEAEANRFNDQVIAICSQLEAELSELSPENKTELLSEYGLKESGLKTLARSGFDLLDLQTYLTTGPKESRAWTISKGTTAPKAAGVIHTDFEKGFIRANVISVTDFVRYEGWKTAKEKGKVRQEGKDYIMQDGDIVEFLFNV